MKRTRRRQLTADLLLFMVTAIWGGTFVMVKDAVSTYPVYHFLAIRFALATVGLAVVAARRVRGLGWRGVGAGALIGLFLFMGYAFQTVGLQYTTASKAGLITGMSVVMVPILSALVIRRAPGRAAVVGVALATVGLVLLTLGPDTQLRVERGDLLVLGCALGFALHIVSVSVFAPRSDPLGLTLVQVATVAALSGAVAFGQGPRPAPTPQAWYAALFTGVLATALAFALQNSLQRHTTPTHTALIFAAEPVFAALFGVWLAGETLLHRGIAGGVLIVAGTLASEVDWSERTARAVSRALGPQVAAVPLLVILGVRFAGGWGEGLAWAGAIWALAVLGPAAARWLCVGRCVRRQATPLPRPLPMLAEVMGPLIATGLLVTLDGEPLLLLVPLIVLGAIAARAIRRSEVLTSGHVLSASAATTALTAALGVIAAPSLLLVPLVGWARVRVGAQTPGRAVIAALGGALGVLAALRAAGVG